MTEYRIYYRIETIFSLGLLIIQLNFNYVNSAVANYFRYCENGNYANISQSSCSNGINFGLGSDQPSCVCIKGIYRIYTDGCTAADGFATEEICTTLTEDGGSASWSMKLAPIPSGFTWTTPAIVCQKLPDSTWSLSIGPAPVTTSSDDFYAVNGKGFLMSDGSICVEGTNTAKNNICRYYQDQNKAPWKNASQYSISLKSSCSGGTPLKEDSCFSPLNSGDSECSVVCAGGGGGGGPGTGPTMPGQTTKRPSVPGVGGSGNKLKTTKKSIQLTKADFDKNCTDPDDYRNHDNRFLNRKMLLYNVVNQLDMRADSDGSILKTMEPNKTLDLFDFMKNITKKLCPTEYVKSQWIDQAVDLFYILHKGNVFRYEEQLSPEQYEWIRDILSQCDTSAIPIPLTSMDDSTGECSGGASGLATGYCKNSPDSSCNFVPVTVDTTGEDSHRMKHYVPEVAWNIVDAIHVACFPQFNESYRMFHVLEQAVERIFTLQIKNLWHHPGWLEKTKTKLLGFGADTNMYNFEVCIQAAYGLRNGDLPRLIRPFSPVYLRKKRAASKKQKVFVKKPGGRSSIGSNPVDPSIGTRTTKNPKQVDRDSSGVNPGPVDPNAPITLAPTSKYQTGCVKTSSELRKPPNCVWNE